MSAERAEPKYQQAGSGQDVKQTELGRIIPIHVKICCLLSAVTLNTRDDVVVVSDVMDADTTVSMSISPITFY